MCIVIGCDIGTGMNVDGVGSHSLLFVRYRNAATATTTSYITTTTTSYFTTTTTSYIITITTTSYIVTTTTTTSYITITTCQALSL